MKNINYPYISFAQTEQNEKTLVMTYPSKDEAIEWYGQLASHNLCWYRNKEDIIISLKVADGSYLTIKLLQPIELYRNYQWFLENKLTHITTDWRGSNTEDKMLPTSLNQQIPCP